MIEKSPSVSRSLPTLLLESLRSHRQAWAHSGQVGEAGSALPPGQCRGMEGVAETRHVALGWPGARYLGLPCHPTPPTPDTPAVVIHHAPGLKPFLYPKPSWREAHLPTQASTHTLLLPILSPEKLDPLLFMPGTCHDRRTNHPQPRHPLPIRLVCLLQWSTPGLSTQEVLSVPLGPAFSS